MNCGREQNPIQGCPVEVKVYNPHEKNVDARTIRLIKLAKYRLKAQVEKDEGPEWIRMKAQRQRHYQDY